MNQITDTIFQPEIPLRRKVSYLNSALSGHTFCAESERNKELVKKIIDLLVPEKSRCEGLALLENSLQQCPVLYAETTWSGSLLHVLENRNAPTCKELACKCLILIVENQARNTAHEPGARNILVPAIMNAVIDKVHDTDAWLHHALRLAAVCMKNFPYAVAQQKREELREFILKLMDCVQVEVQDALADCFTALPACMVRSSEKYKTVWQEQVEETVKILHSILNYFFTFCNKDFSNFKTEPSKNTYVLPPDEEGPAVVVIIKKAQQFCTLCKCLARMLSTHSRYTVAVPISHLMKLLERIILASEDSFNIPTDVESHAILTIFPAIQNAGCILLEAMILNFPAEMEAVSQYITRLFDGLLRASRTNPVTRFPQSQLRSFTWRLINLWIVQYGTTGLVYILQENILEELLVEIGITELPAEVTESVKNQKVSLDIYTVKSPAGAWAVSSCCEALGVFRDMFYIGMPFLEHATVQNITEQVILTLCKIQNSKDFPFPYGKVDSRRRLYEVLLAIVTSSPQHGSFSLRHCIGIFNRGLKDSSLQVVRICQQSITHCKNILHPKKYTPVGIQTPIQPKVDEEWHRNTWGSEIPWTMEENQLEHDVPQISETVEIASPPPIITEQKLHIDESYSAAVYNEPVSESQVNGENEVMPKFQNWRQDADELEEEIIVEKKNFKDVPENATSEPKLVYSFSESVPVIQEVEVDSVGAQNSYSEQSSDEKMECEQVKVVEKDQPVKLNEEVCQNGDVVVSDEEVPQVSKAGNGSISSSEENSEEYEEEIEEEEYEEAESVEDSPVKKLQISSEDMESDDGNPPPLTDAVCEEVEAEENERELEPQADLPELVESEDKPPASPSLKEMCNTFVLCESKDAS